MLSKGKKALPEDCVDPAEEIKDPFVLEFLGLKDEYSESDLEEALIRHLEGFLLELGSDFCFIGRQKRLRIGDEWYRVDLLFFPSAPAMPGDHRPEDRKVHPRRCRPDAPLSQLCAGTLGS
jgi:predicted nuclease of restriction endonuclease-like (RecB) superfamily